MKVAELLFLEAHRFRRKVPGETVGFPAGAGGRDGRNGGGENSEKDEEFCHRGEETKMEKVFVSTCATILSYKCMNEDKNKKYLAASLIVSPTLTGGRVLEA